MVCAEGPNDCRHSRNRVPGNPASTARPSAGSEPAEGADGLAPGTSPVRIRVPAVEEARIGTGGLDPQPGWGQRRDQLQQLIQVLLGFSALGPQQRKLSGEQLVNVVDNPLDDLQKR